MATPNSLAAQALARAKSQGAQKLWQSYPYRHTDALNRVRGAFAHSSKPEVRRAVLDNPAVVQHFLIVDNVTKAILPFVNPIITNSGVVGNTNDWIGQQANPVQIPLEAFHGFVVSLVPVALAKECGWPFASAPAPDLVPGPTIPATLAATAAATTNSTTTNTSTTSGSNATSMTMSQTTERSTTTTVTTPGTTTTTTTTPLTAPPTFERLQFGSDPTAEPVFTAVPLVLPVPLGFDVPDNLSLDTPFPTSIAAAFPEVEIWRKSLLYLQTHNAARSLITLDSPMFDVHHIKSQLEPPTLFDNLTLHDVVDYQVTIIRRGTKEFALVDKATQEQEIQAFTRIGLTLPPPQDTNSSIRTTATPEQVVVPDSFAQALLQLTATRPVTSSLSEREHLSRASETLAKYELALATPDGNKLRITSLSDPFREFIGRTSLPDAARGLTNMMEHARAKNCSSATSDKFLFWTNFTPEQFDRTVASGLREFAFLRESLNLADTRPFHRITPLIHLPPNKNSLDFQERLTHELAIQGQESVGLDKSKVAPRSTTLYLGGQMHSPGDAVSTIMNMRAFWLQVTPDFDATSLGQVLDIILQVLLTDSGRDWMRFCATKQYSKVVTAHLISLIHDCTRPFFDQANQPQLVRARLDGEDIQPDNWIAFVEQAKQLLIPLRSAINAMNIGEFANPPYYLHILWPREYGSTPAQPPTKRQALGMGPYPTKSAPVPKEALKPPPRDNSTRGHDKGFLVWSGGRLPQCPVFVPNKDGKPERLCLYFACRSQTCRYRPCGQVHVSNFAALPLDAQKQLNDFVKKTEGLEYAPRSGPQGKATV
jgi:hypothetical protein